MVGMPELVIGQAKGVVSRVGALICGKPHAPT